MGKHTPGPWYYEEGHTDSYCVCDLGLFKVYGDELEHSREAIDADARLIAAAPELLEALEAALKWIDAVPMDVQLPTMPGFDRDWVNSTIAKAKGK